MILASAGSSCQSNFISCKSVESRRSWKPWDNDRLMVTERWAVNSLSFYNFECRFNRTFHLPSMASSSSQSPASPVDDPHGENNNNPVRTKRRYGASCELCRRRKRKCPGRDSDVSIFSTQTLMSALMEVGQVVMPALFGGWSVSLNIPLPQLCTDSLQEMRVPPVFLLFFSLQPLSWHVP